MAEAVTRREFARLEGCDEKQVRRALLRGLLVADSEGKLDSAQVGSSWRKPRVDSKEALAPAGADIPGDKAADISNVPTEMSPLGGMSAPEPVGKRSALTRTRAPAVVDKAELCAALGWTRPRLDRRIDSDGDFPVKRRGTRAGGWEFDVDRVVAYLDGVVVAQVAPIIAPAAVPETEPTTAAYQGDAPGAAHRGESTASQRLKNAQAARVEDGLRKDRRELIEAEEMRVVLGTMLARLGKGLDSLADMATKRLGLADEASDVLRGMIDEVRQSMVTDLKTLLESPTPLPS